MIDKNYKESDLSQAKKIALKYISNPVINGKKITDILVLIKEHAVYINTPIENLQEYADRIKSSITVVMEKGILLEDTNTSEPIKKGITVENKPTENEPKSEKKNKIKK